MSRSTSTGRKKWRVTFLPVGQFEARARSKQHAYAMVAEVKHAYWRGESEAREAHVEVDEGDGYGWALYEQVRFPYTPRALPAHRAEATYGLTCSTCDGGGCPDCTDPIS